MNFFDFPIRTKVSRVVPKNAFDKYINTKQKKLFTDNILRITWTHKLSSDTLNLDAKDVKEIQVFKVELKKKSDVSKVIEIINKFIPYHIVFWIEHDQEAFISTAAKHPHPTNNDVSVIDWTFTTQWFNRGHNTYSFNLAGDLDTVFKDLCVQITGNNELGNHPMDLIVNHQKEIDQLRKEISKLKLAVSRSKQFNEKVDLNIELNEKEEVLAEKTVEKL